MATRVPTTSRRTLLASAPALLLAGPAPASAAQGDDAELIAACAAFDRLEREKVALCDSPDGPKDHAYVERRAIELHTAQEPHLEAICGTVASTLDGMRARAGSLALWQATDREWLASEYWDDRMMRALIRDLAGPAAPPARG